MAPRRLLHATLAMTAALLAGCGGQAGPTLSMTPALGGSSGANTLSDGATVTISAVKVATTASAQVAPNELIVHFKGDQHDLPGMTLKNPMPLHNTYVYGIDRGAYGVQAIEDLESAPDIDYVEPNYTYTALADTPNDPLFAQSWGIGAIGAPAAWASSTGDGVTVAVLDSGINADHPDLAGQVLPGEDLVNGTASAADDFGHGTHVAGTIAAIADNGVGVAGVAPHAKLLPIKVLDAQGTGSNATIAQGVLDAAARGAKIINLSLGGPDNSETLARAISQVEQQGVIVVAAAGNDGSTTPFYPAANDGVIAVGAVDRNAQKASFSNDGSYLTIAAPGVGILSTGFQGGYVSMSGTSMATPHVAGAAALLLAQYPHLNAAQLSKILQASGTTTSGFSASGIKEVNVAQALAYAATLDFTPPTVVTGLSTQSGAPGAVGLNWSPATDNRAVSGYKVLRDGEVIATVTTTSYTDLGLVPGGKASYSVVAFDADGNQSAPCVAVSGVAGQASSLYQNLAVSGRSSSALTLSWTTSQPVRSYVQWGRTSGFGAATTLEASATTKHSVTLSGLSRFSKYYFRVLSTDATGNTVYSDTLSGRTKLWFLFGS